ncbi:phosphatase PAP2 family protein [Frankia sp. ACN1ag]|uniref:phosphatase PAP2 family protein n=1 Tax=Frankia sp. ACN1ag TaxID=102891 RepID=UPI0006DD2E98|nr:phosphatase PAP2 family protein [Frankia sp. ACN1ag]KQC36001.1 phospholipid phosphatase [Frankia sp. ACN1ag]
MRSLLGLGGRLVAAAGLLVLILAGTGALLVHGPGQVRGWDTDAERWLADHRTGGLVRLTADATYLADTWTVIAATAVLAAAVGWWTRRWWLPAGIILLTAGETAVYEASNALVGRPRPAVPRLDPGDPLASFPSGHTAAAVCLYGGLALVLRRLAADGRFGRLPAGSGAGQGGGVGGGQPSSARPWWVRAVLVASVVVAVAVPVLVGFCRTYRGMHHPSDVLGGAFLGACWLAAVNRVVLGRRGAHDPRRGGGSSCPPPAARRVPDPARTAQPSR